MSETVDHGRLGRLALSRQAVDRAAERRSDEAWIAGAWADPRTRVLVLRDGRALARPAGDGMELLYVPPQQAPDGNRLLLGVDDEGTAYFGVSGVGGDATIRSEDEGFRPVGLRQVGALLSDRDAGLFTHAAALANWHDSHTHCPRCGTPTVVSPGGHVTLCPSDGTQHFPRVDPAVIMLVTDPEDRCLLARNATWPQRRMSVLAGFVDPGESAEHAVVREVREETAIEVGQIEYLGSQPWPMPRSLMLGYRAVAPGGQTITVDEKEIAEARWFTRTELRTALEAGDLGIAPTSSIARRLIEFWYGGELPDGPAAWTALYSPWMSEQHAPYGDYQLEIYLNGLAGVVPDLPMDFAGLAERARQAMSASVWSYVAGGAGDERTQDANVAAFARWGLYPRMLVGAKDRDLSVDLFGMTLPSPLLMAPIGVTGLCSQDGHGDLAAADAAARTGVPLIGSTLMNDPLEDVAARLGDTPGFFQLYTPTDRDLAASLVHRAEAAGYRAIVVTLDTWITGWRPRDLSTSNFPQLRGHCLANYTSDPVFSQLPGDVVSTFARIFGNPLTWDDLPWLRSLTSLPLLVKGICHPDDARRAVDGGVDGVYCSNHGGRQANGGLPALDCLPDVVSAVPGVPVIFDSGIRGGADIVKAIALGATAVAVGRPYAYGLALGGARGAVHVLRSLLAEADLIMAVNGYPALADLTPAALRRVDT